ncbi:hypothetical protein COCOBI_08-5660 [Coccomyxa sp. Obi]|nr:hypothetical protein COCOBI_08-5660 [Coccomyxa sp. Obi]
MHKFWNIINSRSRPGLQGPGHGLGFKLKLKGQLELQLENRANLEVVCRCQMCRAETESFAQLCPGGTV